MDLFGGDSDTTSDYEDDEDTNNIGALDVQPAAEAVESHPPAPPVGRALFARAVSDDTDTGDDGDRDRNGGGETKGEDSQPPPPHPSTSFAAVPVKTLPRPVYEGDKEALINLCHSWRSTMDEVRDLIARGINIDEQDKDGRTALIRAALTDLPEIVQELIRAGAALDVQDTLTVSYAMALYDRNVKGLTALMFAAKYNHIAIAQELIRAGAALDVQDSAFDTKWLDVGTGWTALMWAAQKNNLEMVQELIRAGAALDVQDNYKGRTALRIAQEHDGTYRPRSTEIATLLREAGARCLRYKRSGVFNSKCKFCRESKKGHS